MINLQAICKPRTVEEAIELLKRPGTVVMAGASGLVASKRQDVNAVVDLAGLGLDYIRDEQGAVAIGATTRLSELADSPILRAATDGVVAEAAHASASSLLRNQATVAGTLITEPAGILAVALAALDASVSVHTSEPNVSPARSGSSGSVTLKVVDFLRQRGRMPNGYLITEVQIPAAALVRRAVIETVARTPRDKPIVSTCCSLEMNGGQVRTAAIALGGVAETAVRASGAEEILRGTALEDTVIGRASGEAAQGLMPRADFRGTSEYRLEMVRVLVARALRSVRNRQVRP